jgi:acetoacetyl-CoA synthetase
LDDSLRATIRRELAQQGSPAHVPAVLLAVPELPTTWSGKTSERSARDVLNAREAVNAEALRNPASLEPLRDFLRAGSEKPATTVPAVTAPAPGGIVDIGAMCALWSEVLQQAGLSPQDNFFDLGGDSLAALDLVEAVRTRFGHSAPMDAIFGAPTIEEFTKVVNGQIQRTSPLLVPLKSGGGASPLYIVHGYGGSIMELRPLIQAIDTDVPVIGIRASGFEQGEPIYDRVEDMADAYIAELRKAQPRGPYRIGGYSVGGLVAFEMARRLTKGGERVASVLLIDTTVHQSHWSGRAWREFLWRRTGYHLRRLSDRPGTGRHIVQMARALWGHLRLAVSGATPKDSFSGIDLPEQVRRLRIAGLHAFTYYAPTSDQLPIVLIRSDLRFSTLADPVAIWRDLTPSLAVHDAPGDHLSMIIPPQLKKLAEVLSGVLQKSAA